MNLHRFMLLMGHRIQAPVLPRPVPLAPPTISGAREVGQYLIVLHGLYDHGPIEGYLYKWLVDGVELDGEATQPLLLTEELLGADNITVREWARNAQGFSVAPNESAPVGPVVAPSGAVQVGPGWVAGDGSADTGFTSVPDPIGPYNVRMAANSRQQPTGHIAFGPTHQIMTGDIQVMAQCELVDADPASPTFGRPMALNVDFLWENDTPHTVNSRSTRGGVDLLGRPWSAHGFWATLRKPTEHVHCTPGGPGAQCNLYLRIRPVDNVRFDENIVGPFPFFPRDESAWVTRRLHKTAPVGGDVVRSMVDVMNLAVAEYTQSGRPVRGLICDNNKKWAPGRRALSTVIPWLTRFSPGPDVATGLQCKWNLGDPDNRHSLGYWAPGLERVWWEGYHHDVAETGGIQALDGTRHYVMTDHDTYCGTFPGTFGAISRYGSGSGAAALVRGRLASGAPLKPSSDGLPTKFVSQNGFFHDLPGKGIESFEIDFCNDSDNISGSVIGNSFGCKYGGVSSRFGGFYSGITTTPGDTNPALRVVFSGGQGYYGVRRTGNVGANGSFTVWAAASRAAALAAGPIATFAASKFKRLDELAAEISAHPACIAANITAADVHGEGPDLDVTHLWMPGLVQSSPLQGAGGGPYDVVGTSIDICAHADVHANGYAWATADIRKGLSVRDSIWTQYCGAGEVAVSTNDPDPALGQVWDEFRLYDVYFVGCSWFNEMGFTNRKGGWSPIGAQQGRVIGVVNGCAFSHCVISGGGLYSTAEKIKRQIVYGYVYGRLGALTPGVGAIGNVSTMWAAPEGSLNSKALLPTPAQDPHNDELTFVAPRIGDVHLLDPSKARLPDGINFAGRYAEDGTDLSRIDY